MDTDEAVLQYILPLSDRCFVTETALIGGMNPHFGVAGFYICYFCLYAPCCVRGDRMSGPPAVIASKRLF